MAMIYKMTLFIYDRINIPQILPQKSNLVEAVLCAEIKKKVGLTSQDIEKNNIVVTNEQITWNDKVDEGLEVEFTKGEIELIQKSFIKLSDDNNFPTDVKFLTFYQKFVEPIPEKVE